MKTLLLMRHAKSGLKQPGLPDGDRHLNKRGKKDAPHMGRLLKDNGLVPQFILSSTALRARQTAEAVAQAAGYEGDILYCAELYGAEPLDYIQVLRSIPDELSPVLVVGHNPGLKDLLVLLTNQVEDLPTATVVQLTLAIERWKDLQRQTVGQLVQVWHPGEHLTG